MSHNLSVDPYFKAERDSYAKFSYRDVLDIFDELYALYMDGFKKNRDAFAARLLLACKILTYKQYYYNDDDLDAIGTGAASTAFIKFTTGYYPFRKCVLDYHNFNFLYKDLRKTITKYYKNLCVYNSFGLRLEEHDSNAKYGINIEVIKDCCYGSQKSIDNDFNKKLFSLNYNSVWKNLGNKLEDICLKHMDIYFLLNDVVPNKISILITEYLDHEKFLEKLKTSVLLLISNSLVIIKYRRKPVGILNDIFNIRYHNLAILCYNSFMSYLTSALIYVENGNNYSDAIMNDFLFNEMGLDNNNNNN